MKQLKDTLKSQGLPVDLLMIVKEGHYIFPFKTQ